MDTFQPEFLLHVNWTNETAAQLGNSIRPSLLKDPPQNLSLIRPAPAAVTATNTLNLVLALTDPDALSREDPVWSEMCHWITYVRSKGSQARSKTKEIMSYFPPGPPPKTGSHRYVILALTPINGTTQKLHLSKPLDRKHWGYQGVRVGVRRWAQENGLRVIGKFISSSNLLALTKTTSW